MTSQPTHALTATSGQVRLSGELWLPLEPPHAVVLMVPGSGPSDRHNDVFFPPIRSAVLEAGFAVASFDKRGVGGSAGDWRTAGIEIQAQDARAALNVLSEREELAGIGLGLFGHSQGGWVVVEAAARDRRVSFVVANSGPGVSPAEQEHFAADDGLRRAGVTDDAAVLALDEYDEMYEMLRRGERYSAFRSWLEADPDRVARFELLASHAFVPTDEGVWDFAQLVADYDPRPNLQRIDVPILALFGAEDRLVPVPASVRTYEELAHNVTTRVFAGADHRCQVGDPPEMADGYLELLTEWLREVSRSRQHRQIALTLGRQHWG